MLAIVKFFETILGQMKIFRDRKVIFTAENCLGQTQIIWDIWKSFGTEMCV